MMQEHVQKSGKWIPWVYVALFVVVMGVNGLFVYLASSTFSGVSVENAYERGLDYNNALAQATAQKALGWKADIDFTSTGKGEGTLHVSLSDEEGEAIQGAQVELQIVRPAQAGYDTALELSPAEGGYSAAVKAPLPGLWEARMKATYGSSVYRSSERFMVE